MLSKNRILLTGASGLLGSYLVNEIDINSEIYCVSRNVISSSKNNRAHINIDLSEDWSMDCLPGEIDTVIHLAQSENFRAFPEQALDVFNVNISSTAKLLDYAVKAGAKKFILASSGGIYGVGNKIFDEESDIIASSTMGYYLGSKLCGEVLAEAYSAHMDIIMLRFFFLYGENQNRSMLIPRLVDNVREKKPIKLQGVDGIHINPIHARDSAIAVNKAITLRGSHKINIAGSEVLSLRDIGNIIGRNVGVEPIFDVHEDEQAFDLIGDNKKMKKLLCKPNTLFSNGVRDAL